MSGRSILYISHGGGPLPLLDDPGHREMVDFLAATAAELPRPRVILVVSAHWEAGVPTLTGAAEPPLVYDYYNFPPESYEIRYPAPGSPGLAAQVRDRLQGAGIDAAIDADRGLDHGVFVPLKLMYPDAGIPCVQLSLTADLDPARHLAIGRALAGLDADALMVIGSGFSFHNMGAFFGPDTEDVRARNVAFDGWLNTTCADAALDAAARERRLLDWAEAPAARFCHPREEHLLPLHVCCGMAECAPAKRAWRHTIIGKRASAFLW